MSEHESQNKPISEILAQELAEYGYDKNNRISQSELLLFLNRKSPEGKFDPALSEKLFQILNLSESSTISIEEFINGYLQFEEEIKKDAEQINTQYTQEKEVYDNIMEQCQKYESEPLNDEGFSEDAKLCGEIVDINLKSELEGMKEIIIKIIHGDQEQEIRHKLGEEKEGENENKFFEFKASTKKDNLEFVLQAKNDSGEITDIGSKAYSLDGINSQDEFFVAIEIPENANDKDEENNEEEEKLAAEIKAKISLHWSNYKYYDLQRRKEEPELDRLNTAVEQAEDYVKKVQVIYNVDDKSLMQASKKEEEAIRLRQSRRSNMDETFKSRKLFEFPINKFVVEYNNERVDEIISKGVEVEYNNTIEVTTPTKFHLSTNLNQGEDELQKEQDEKNEENKQTEQVEQNENEQVEQHENEHIEENNQFLQNANEQLVQNENGQFIQNANEQFIQNTNEQFAQNTNAQFVQNTNEQFVQNENFNLNQNNQQYDGFLYSQNNNMNFNISNENQNININNLNLGENAQEQIDLNNINYESTVGNTNDNIQDSQNYSYINKAVINESTNKVLFQENTLPLKYLPEKVNKVIVDSNVSTLPLIIGRKSITYSTIDNNPNINNLLGFSQVNQNTPMSMSYQDSNTVNQYQYGF